ncbi:MAG: hypothetical protein ACRD6W_17950 [Nitrososphaerales archaeon]
MKIYGTEQERLQRGVITHHFPGCTLVDPGTLQSNPEKTRRGMEYCLELVDACDSVVFSRFKDLITAGVGKEVNHGLLRGKSVYEIQRLNVVQITEPVDYLSRDDTIALYIGQAPLPDARKE